MLSDGLTLKQSEGEAREEVEVLDVAQMLLAGVKRAPSAEESAAVVAEAEAATSSATGAVSGSGGPDEVTDVDKAAAAASNIDVDDAGSRTGDAPEARSDETAPPAPEPEPVAAPEPEAKADPAEEAEPDADDKADESITKTEDVGPAAEATETVDEVDEVDDRAASDKEAAAWANVGPVDADSEPVRKSRDPGDTTDPETELVPQKSDRDPEIPATKTSDDSPSEHITHVPDETHPVDEDARDEEAASIIAVEDVESTADPVSEDAAPLSDANPSGADLTKAAGGGETASDDEDDEPKP
jgi:hypothetical protein